MVCVHTLVCVCACPLVRSNTQSEVIPPIDTQPLAFTTCVINPLTTDNSVLVMRTFQIGCMLSEQERTRIGSCKSV